MNEQKIKYATVTNPFSGDTSMQTAQIERTAPNLKKAAGTTGLVALGGGLGIAVYAGLMELVAKGKISVTAAGAIQAIAAVLVSMGFGAYDYERLAAALGTGQMAFGGGMLIEQLRLAMQQQATRAPGTTSPAVSPTATPGASAAPTTSPLAGLPGSLKYGPRGQGTRNPAAGVRRQ